MVSKETNTTDTSTAPTAEARRRVQGLRSAALLVGLFGVAFQVVHFLEHGLQLGYWVLFPESPPWLTPWAGAGAATLAFDGQLPTGNELLHAVGNIIFLAGLIGMALVARAAGHRLRSLRPLQLALWVQGVHVLEHVTLVVTWLTVGTALGASTLFGRLEGPVLFTYRIWWHFMINLVATVLAVQGLALMARLGILEFRAGGGPATASDVS